MFLNTRRHIKSESKQITIDKYAKIAARPLLVDQTLYDSNALIGTIDIILSLLLPSRLKATVQHCSIIILCTLFLRPKNDTSQRQVDPDKYCIFLLTVLAFLFIMIFQTSRISILFHAKRGTSYLYVTCMQGRDCIKQYCIKE